MRQQVQERINQRNYELEQAHVAQQHTSNMSAHDKSQYYLEHRQFNAFNAQGYDQQFNSIVKLDQRNNQLKFSIPIGH